MSSRKEEALKFQSRMDSMLEEWQLFYNRFPKCIYPKYNIRLGSFYRDGTDRVELLLETLVEDKAGKFLILSRETDLWNGQYDPKFLEQGLERFSNKNYLIHNNAIFNDKTAIRK